MHGVVEYVYTSTIDKFQHHHKKKKVRRKTLGTWESVTCSCSPVHDNVDINGMSGHPWRLER
jgi:hypothetical protein